MKLMVAFVCLVLMALSESADDLQPEKVIRRNLHSLTNNELQLLQSAYRKIKTDTSYNGANNLATMHGVPPICPSRTHPKYVCCPHSEVTFLLWHRLLTIQFEQSLQLINKSLVFPFFDWTLPGLELHELFTNQTYFDETENKVLENPFYRNYIPSEGAYTARDVIPAFHNVDENGRNIELYKKVLHSLEQEDFCLFQWNLELVHNQVHDLIGGSQKFSMASQFSAYDPFFICHHQNVDRLFAIWQKLMRNKNQPSNRTDCSKDFTNEPLAPFSFPDNPSQYTRDHAIPSSVFDLSKLPYAYDQYGVGGFTFEQVQQQINAKKTRDNVVIEFQVKKTDAPAVVKFNVCCDARNCSPAGSLNLFGSPLSKHASRNMTLTVDVTEELEKLFCDLSKINETGVITEIEVKDRKGRVLSPKEILIAHGIKYLPRLEENVTSQKNVENYLDAKMSNSKILKEAKTQRKRIIHIKNL